MVACRQHKAVNTYKTYIEHNGDESPKDYPVHSNSSLYHIYS